MMQPLNWAYQAIIHATVQLPSGLFRFNGDNRITTVVSIRLYCFLVEDLDVFKVIIWCSKKKNGGFITCGVITYKDFETYNKSSSNSSKVIKTTHLQIVSRFKRDNMNFRKEFCARK